MTSFFFSEQTHIVCSIFCTITREAKVSAFKYFTFYLIYKNIWDQKVSSLGAVLALSDFKNLLLSKSTLFIFSDVSTATLFLEPFFDCVIFEMFIETWVVFLLQSDDVINCSWKIAQGEDQGEEENFAVCGLQDFPCSEIQVRVYVHTALYRILLFLFDSAFYEENEEVTAVNNQLQS